MKSDQIGAHLRQIRKAKAVSLLQLAEKSGFSKGYLSKLENGHAQPPIATLMKLAQALGVSINQLFDGGIDDVSQLKSDGILTRRTEREEVADPGERGYRFERLAVDSPFRLTPYLIHLEDDQAPTRSFQHAGEEIIFMVEGACDYRVGERIHRLEAGDTLVFDALVEHGPMKLPGVTARYFAVFDEHSS